MGAAVRRLGGRFSTSVGWRARGWRDGRARGGGDMAHGVRAGAGPGASSDAEGGWPAATGAGRRGAGRGCGAGRLGCGVVTLGGGGLGELAGLPQGEEGFEPGEDAQEPSLDEGAQGCSRSPGGAVAAQIGGDAGDLVGQVAGLALIH